MFTCNNNLYRHHRNPKSLHKYYQGLFHNNNIDSHINQLCNVPEIYWYSNRSHWPSNYQRPHLCTATASFQSCPTVFFSVTWQLIKLSGNITSGCWPSSKCFPSPSYKWSYPIADFIHEWCFRLTNCADAIFYWFLWPKLISIELGEINQAFVCNEFSATSLNRTLSRTRFIGNFYGWFLAVHTRACRGIFCHCYNWNCRWCFCCCDLSCCCQCCPSCELCLRISCRLNKTKSSCRCWWPCRCCCR